MTDQELNEAAARGLGWIYEDGEWHKYANGICVDEQDLPDYCHSIAAAWEIMNLPVAWDLVKQADEIQARLYFPGGNILMAAADTAPMAICLAFLKLNDKTI